jgi:hypothetical protein
MCAVYSCETRIHVHISRAETRIIKDSPRHLGRTSLVKPPKLFSVPMDISVHLGEEKMERQEALAKIISQIIIVWALDGIIPLMHR